ncbi:MAG: hypothetical protein AB7V47_15540 [Phycisphaerales bacterium]
MSTIRTAGHILALLLLSLTAFTQAMAQTPGQNYGYCQGLAGNPRVNNYTRLFVLGPSSPPGAMSGFLQYLHKKHSGYTTQEVGCRTFATVAEAETAYRQMQDEAAQAASAWPPVEVDWIPEGGSSLSGAAPVRASAPAPAAVKPKAPAPAAAAAPAAATGVQLDRWGKPIPTSAYWFCNSYVRMNSYASAPFVANTLDRSPQEMYEQFLDYLNKRYHESGNPTCNRFATLAEAEARIAQLAAEAPGEGRQFAKIDYIYAPGSSKSSQPVPASAPQPTQATVPAPRPAPTPVAVAPAPATAAVVASKPAVPAVKPATFVICRSEFNTNPSRFYNPPVNVAGGGYPEWQASYRAFLLSRHKFQATNVSCGKYPTQEAAQADFESWVVAARQQPTINGQNSPVTITHWTY